MFGLRSHLDEQPLAGELPTGPSADPNVVQATVPTPGLPLKQILTIAVVALITYAIVTELLKRGGKK